MGSQGGTINHAVILERHAPRILMVGCTADGQVTRVRWQMQGLWECWLGSWPTSQLSRSVPASC